MLLSRKLYVVLPPLAAQGSVTSGFRLPSLRRQSSNCKAVKECYRVLGVSEGSSMREVKEAFVHMARKYHPDSSSGTANAAKFDEIKSAYETVRGHLSGDAATAYDDVYEVMEKDFGIKHTVPQHRQYLSFEGVGHGTPTQRWQQYQQHRLRQAAQRVHDHRLGSNRVEERTLVLKDATLARQYKTTQAIERLVEDLIQESMARGEFDNLRGSGKPLKFAPENPYVDSTTRKLNEVLITNGYVPEWVVLEREIGEEKRRLRAMLAQRLASLGDEEALRGLEPEAARLNRKIDKFNMVVPLLNKQQPAEDGASHAARPVANGRRPDPARAALNGASTEPLFLTPQQTMELDEDREPIPDAETMEFYRIGPPVPSILRKPGQPSKRRSTESLPHELRCNGPPPGRTLRKKQSVSVIAFCSLAMVTLVGVFWGYIIHGIVHAEGGTPSPPHRNREYLKASPAEEVLRNLEDSDYAVPNLVFLTERSKPRRVPVVVLRRHPQSSPPPPRRATGRPPYRFRRSSTTRRRRPRTTPRTVFQWRSKVLASPNSTTVDGALFPAATEAGASNATASVGSSTERESADDGVSSSPLLSDDDTGESRPLVDDDEATRAGFATVRSNETTAQGPIVNGTDLDYYE
ncbi:uncharacterized protein LOC144120418 isoform X3 [Amblyomma americanum]